MHPPRHDESLINEDIAPVPLSKRTWSAHDIAALWIGMAVCIPTYTIASSLLGSGLTWWQAVLTVFLGPFLTSVTKTAAGWSLDYAHDQNITPDQKQTLKGTGRFQSDPDIVRNSAFNEEEQSNVIAEVARTVVDPAKVFTRSQPKMGSEDFADMLQVVPGAYFWLGHEGSVLVHNPGYILDDKILPIGASMFARIIETRLPAGAHA